MRRQTSKHRRDPRGERARGLIIRALEAAGHSLTHADIAEAMGMKPRQVASHCEILVRQGVVYRRRHHLASGRVIYRVYLRQTPPPSPDPAWFPPAVCPRAGGNTSAPCPWVRCRYHLWYDSLTPSQATDLVHGRRLDDLPSPVEMVHPCALTLAIERRGMTLAEIGEVMGGISRERVRQLIMVALDDALGVADDAHEIAMHLGEMRDRAEVTEPPSADRMPTRGEIDDAYRRVVPRGSGGVSRATWSDDDLSRW